MSHDKIKAAARLRMATTGESYETARREVIKAHQASPDEPGQARYATGGGIPDGRHDGTDTVPVVLTPGEHFSRPGTASAEAAGESPFWFLPAAPQARPGRG